MKLSVASRRAAAVAAAACLIVAPALLQAEPPKPKAAPAAGGTIKGRLVWAVPGAIPALEPEPAAKSSKDPVCSAKPAMKRDYEVDAPTKGVANAFAYLVKPTGDYKDVEEAVVEKTPTVTVDQKDCEYVPYATVVHKDQKLVFKSSDPIGHNVDFKPFTNPAINPMLPPNGKVNYAIKAAEKRPTMAACSIHPWMKGYVFIVDHPFAVVTKTDGSFEIAGVPAGTQMFVITHPKAGYVTEGLAKGQAVTVKAGETTDLGEIKLKTAK